MSYPDSLEILPLTKPPQATIRVPGSKSITNRALVLAALSQAGSECRIESALQSEDTEIMIECLTKLGFKVRPEWSEGTIHVTAGEIGVREAKLFVGNSGTTMRFLTALVSLGNGTYSLDGVPRMRERPIQDLLDALRQLGVNAYSKSHNGYPPIVVETQGLRGGPTRIKGSLSSQFLSGLLMAGPLALETLRVRVDGELVSHSYVDMTLAMMTQFGISASSGKVDKHYSHFTVLGGQRYFHLGSYQVEPDATAASYFFGASAILRGEVGVAELGAAGLQGDLRFANVLESMGCERRLNGRARVIRGGPLHGIDVDMNNISDTVMTLAAVACFAEGPTTIRNVAHIRHKETDRLAALCTELRKVGAEVEEFPDGLKITPRPLHGAVIETYNDHRMAMSMALIGLKVPGIIINNPGCVAKTYPGFWQDLEKLRQ